MSDTDRINPSSATPKDDNDHPAVNEHETNTGKEENPKNRMKQEIMEWFKWLSIAVILSVGIRVLLFAPIIVDGESMLPTLRDGERLIVNKIIYRFSEPQRGDILVFHAENGRDWIKRVIGEPGDVIEMKNDQLYINGELVDEPYLEETLDQALGILTQDFYAEVPEGHIYVLGDNRLNSRDSRSIGAVSIDSVVGRAEIVFWPLSGIRSVRE